VEEEEKGRPSPAAKEGRETISRIDRVPMETKLLKRERIVVGKAASQGGERITRGAVRREGRADAIGKLYSPRDQDGLMLRRGFSAEQQGEEWRSWGGSWAQGDSSRSPGGRIKVKSVRLPRGFKKELLENQGLGADFEDRKSHRTRS